jgi:hypothetical protein
MIYLDGGVVQTGGEDPFGNNHFDPNSIPANHLLAVEVFRGPAETPARFNFSRPNRRRRSTGQSVAASST